MRSLCFRLSRTHNFGVHFARDVSQFPSVSAKMINLCNYVIKKVITKSPSLIESLHFSSESVICVLRFLSFESDCSVQVFLTAYFHKKKKDAHCNRANTVLKF